ncbi:MAG: hypothetical protein Tsb0010_05060 [Parvularculaceae bacterium]
MWGERNIPTQPGLTGLSGGVSGARGLGPPVEPGDVGRKRARRGKGGEAGRRSAEAGGHWGAPGDIRGKTSEFGIRGAGPAAAAAEIGGEDAVFSTCQKSYKKPTKIYKI